VRRVVFPEVHAVLSREDSQEQQQLLLRHLHEEVLVVAFIQHALEVREVSLSDAAN
jgi:hypothetical protein